MRAARATAAALAAVVAASVSGARRARAADADWSFLGPAREISHSTSASRDTAVLALQFQPRTLRTAGAEFALVSLRRPRVTWRLGFFGMLELEAAAETQPFAPFTNGGIDLWRGLFGYSLALSLDGWAARRCAGCAVELTLSARHESEHQTASGDGTANPAYVGIPIIGNFVMPDVAMRRAVGPLSLEARAQLKIFVPPSRSYTLGPGGDLAVRWRAHPRVHLFSSLFGEYVRGAAPLPDIFLVRALAGPILPSPHGDLYIYAFADAGNRKGLAVYTREATFGFGVRAAFY